MKVSICMLAYNTGPYIARAIESVLAQRTRFNFELIISDNGSTDDTRAIIEQYRQKYPDLIRPILNPENLGMAANFVQTYNYCRAPYIATLDSDDTWTDPYKLQKQVDLLDRDPDLGMVYSDSNVVNDLDEEIEWKEMDHYRSLFGSGPHFFRFLKEGAFIPNLTTCFRKDLIADELAHEDLWFYEDWWLWMRLSMKARFHYLPERTAAYRLHGTNVTIERMLDEHKAARNRQRTYHILYSNIAYFDTHCAVPDDARSRSLIFKKVLMLVFRSHGTAAMRWRMLPLLWRYYPGYKPFARILSKRVDRLTMVAPMRWISSVLGMIEDPMFFVITG